MALIAAAAVSAYIRRRPLHSATLGGILPAGTVQRVLRITKQRGPKQGFYADACFVYVAQLAAMTAFGVLFMHVQVRPCGRWHCVCSANLALRASKLTGGQPLHPCQGAVVRTCTLASDS